MQTLTQQRQIALPWLARLRWIAVIGQIGASLMAVYCLDLILPLHWIALVISITAVSNVLLQLWDRVNPVPDWVVPAILLLDVAMLTILLYFTGGAQNPFIVLYAVHVAMAVVVLGGAWAWLIVAVSSISFTLIWFWNVPLWPKPSESMQGLGQWIALLLVMVLIAYFVGRVSRSLRQREDELADARDRAGRHEHLAALTTLAAGAAHELGTPLGTIALVAKELELSSARREDPAVLAEDARLIRQQVERCREILDRMRVDVVEDAGHRPSFETLAELLEDLQGDLRPDESGRLKITTSEPGDKVVCRSRVLRRAIGVLLRNAFDASPANGSVELFFQRAQGRIMFQVQDGGAGMPESVLRRAGEPFFTTKPPGEGMGMGLFLVRLVAETYGGRFELQSSTGKGTRSILELPDRPASSDADESLETEDAGGGRRPHLPQAPDQSPVEPGI